mgnify:CR=1 FL=1
MDDNTAEFISSLGCAEDALTIERNYFEAKAQSPFSTNAAGIDAMTYMTKLDAQLEQLENMIANTTVAARGGEFKALSEKRINEVRAATEALGAALRTAAELKAVVLAASDFLGVVGPIAKQV